MLICMSQYQVKNTENQKNVLSLSMLGQSPLQASLWVLVLFQQPLASVLLVCKIFVKFYCNENIKDQEVRYVLKLPAGLQCAFKLFSFLGRQ